MITAPRAPRARSSSDLALFRQARLDRSALARVPDAELEALRYALIHEGERAPGPGGAPVHIRADLAVVAEEQAARHRRRPL